MEKIIFFTTVAVGIYGLANTKLSYKEDGLCLMVISIFLFVIVLIIPGTVELILGSKPQALGIKITDRETSDPRDSSQSRQSQ